MCTCFTSLKILDFISSKNIILKTQKLKSIFSVSVLEKMILYLEDFCDDEVDFMSLFSIFDAK